LYIATAIISVLILKSNHWITLFSIIILVLYELIFIKYYLKKKRVGLRAVVETKIDEYKPSEDDYEKVMAKISASISTNSALVGVAFTLLVFSLGFLYLANLKIGLNVETALIFGMLLSLLISGISYLIVLDQYDTAAEPSIDIETKWKMRKQGLNFFVTGWYFLIFGIIIGLSLLHPLLTLAGCIAYTLMHNIFWFQRL
jgi:hypothetical protein